MADAGWLYLLVTAAGGKLWRIEYRAHGDGHKAYLDAGEGAFGSDVDYEQLIKMYGPTTVAPGRYRPAECTGIKKVRV